MTPSNINLNNKSTCDEFYAELNEYYAIYEEVYIVIIMYGKNKLYNSAFTKKMNEVLYKLYFNLLLLDLKKKRLH